MKTATKRKLKLSEESVEAKRYSVTNGAKDLGGALVKSLWDDLLTGTAKSMPEQMFGLEADEKGQDLQEGHVQELKKTEKKVAAVASEHREYYRKVEGGDIVAKQEQVVISRRIEDILIELKRLTKTSSEMQILFREVSNEQVPVNPGKYHETFFEWVLSVVQNARKRVEEGANWLRMFSSKKKQKQYWNMYKKHGTSFGLSGERNVSTQTG